LKQHFNFNLSSGSFFVEIFIFSWQHTYCYHCKYNAIASVVNKSNAYLKIPV